MTTPTREAIEARLKQVEGIRATWKGNAGYAATLDLDIYALRAALVMLTLRQESTVMYCASS